MVKVTVQEIAILPLSTLHKLERTGMGNYLCQHYRGIRRIRRKLGLSDYYLLQSTRWT